jgi:excisionase family DNA binding protein
MANVQKMQIPTPDEQAVARKSSQALTRYADADRVRLSLQTKGAPTDELILPGSVVRVLLGVLTEMAQGNAVSVIPIHQEMTTQQAAELLNVSRPHLVGLLENGKIPFHKVGTHRKVKLMDVLDYQQQEQASRSQALDELAAASQQAGLY